MSRVGVDTPSLFRILDPREGRCAGVGRSLIGRHQRRLPIGQGINRRDNRLGGGDPRVDEHSQKLAGRVVARPGHIARDRWITHDLNMRSVKAGSRREVLVLDLESVLLTRD